jgi:Rha family phage regulatory protein
MTTVNSFPEICPHVTVIDGTIKTNSLKVAEHFGKRHDTVLRAIQNIECSSDFRFRNFAEASYEVDQPNGGKASYVMIEMTRDGFTFLAMGFTGKKAAQWKEAYINAFNAMEQQLLATATTDPQSPPPQQPTLATKQQRRPVVDLVRLLVSTARARGVELDYRTCHILLNAKLGVSHIDELPAEKLPDAIHLVTEWLESYVIAPPQLPRKTVTIH